MTCPDEDAASLMRQRTGSVAGVGTSALSAQPTARRYQTLPDVSIDDVTGFVQYLSGIGERGTLHDLTRDLQMRTDDLLAIIEATDLLGLADMQNRQVYLTPFGERFASVPLDEQKAVLRESSLEHIALMRHVVQELEDDPLRSIDAASILGALEQSFTRDEARKQFNTVVDWGRYAELFTYDDSSGTLVLDGEHSGATGPLAAQSPPRH